MRFSQPLTDDTSLFIDEYEMTSSLPKDDYPSIQCHTSPQEHLPYSIDNKSSLPSSSDYIYPKKVTGNKKINDDKHLLKRASWSPAGHQECGLPPTGKRIDNDHSTINKNPNRIRLRSKPTRIYQLQQPHDISLVRPVSFNERYDHFSNQLLNRNGSLLNQRREPSSLLSVNNSNFISNTSTEPSINTIRSLPLRETNPTCDRLYSSPTRPLRSEYQQKDLNHIDYKLSSPVLNTNTVPLSSPISSSTSSSSSFGCLKGHEESSSLKGSSLNQYTEFTSQTPSIDSSRDDSCHPTTTTTRSIMTMSISPNRHHDQTHSSNTINNTDGLKPPRDQIESTIVSGGCLKTHKNNNNNRTKKSVHFDCHSPTEIRSTSTNYQPSVTVTSSSLSTGNSNSDNDEQKKKSESETVKEKEKIETTRRTIMTTSPLTTNTFHRSFSLSPSPLLKEENNYNRRHSQVKKENVDELNCTTTRRVTFNDGNNCNISPTNGMNNFNGENLTQMPLNTSLVKTPSFDSQTKKSPTTGGFFNFINRSNSNNKSSSSTQQKSKQYSTHDNKCLNTAVEKGDIDKVTINRQKELQSTIDNNINSNNSSNIDSSISLCTNNHKINRSSISMSTKTIKSNEEDSLNNGLLFQPNQSIKKEPFFLSPPKLNDESSSSASMAMQTSTLIISTPPQYHYYLYPPSISKKNSTTNIKKIHQFKPIVLSDTVQNFWPPPPSPSILNNDSEQTIMASTVEQNKQSQSNSLQNKFHSSTYNDDSLSMSNGNQTDVSPPTRSLMLNNKEDDVRSYSEQSSFSNGCLRIESDSSLEDTQASYSERLREKSRSINRPVVMNVNNYSLSRSRSKDTLNNQCENSHSTTRNTLRPKSAGQIRAQALLSPFRHEISNDFQSKRQFFENRTYTDSPSTLTNNKISTNPTINNQQHHVTRCLWNDSSSRQPTPPPPPPPPSDSMIRTTKYVDPLSNQVSLSPSTINRKPVRIVKAVQRSAPSPTISELKHSFATKMNFENDLMTCYSNDNHLSSQYIRNLFPIPDQIKRNRSRQNSDNNDTRITFDDHVRQPELNLKKRLEILKDNQRIINDEIEINTRLGTKLMNIIESKAELNEIEKLKLHINEIETITSVLLKLSCRLAKVENDLSTITDDNAHTKTSLLERREKIQQKHDEAKSLKDGIDRRSRLVINILRKYLSDEQCDEYDHFIRMKSTLLMDTKDIEENLTFLQTLINQSRFENLQKSNSLSTTLNNLQTNYCKSISTTA